MAVLLAAAMPVRIFHSVPVVSSASVLDFLLILVGATLFLDLAFRPIDTGYRALFYLLCIPIVFTIVSLVWSEDRNATLRGALIYAEGVVAYLFVIRELAGLSPARIVTYIKRYSYLVILPAVLLLFHVPGFQPEGAIGGSSGLVSYYFRLSHPVLGPSNNLATVLAFFAPILLYWGYTRYDRRFTRAGLVTVIAICLTLSRGILLAFLLAGLLYAPLARRQQRSETKGLVVKIGTTVALGALAIGIFYAVNGATNNFFKDRFSAANIQNRAQLYADAFTQIAQHPLLGRGGGVTTIVTPAEEPAQAAILSLYSAVPVANPNEQKIKVDVHNTFLQQAVYYGPILGLLISLSFCATAGVFLVRRRTTALAGVIAYALMVQLISFLFESSFEGTVLRVLFYMSVGLATALLRAVETDTTAGLSRQ